MADNLPNIRKFEFRFKLNVKTLLTWLLVGMIVASFFFSFSASKRSEKSIPLSQALVDIKENRVKEVGVQDSQITLTYKDGKVAVSQKEPGVSFTETLKAAEISPTNANLVIKEMPLSKFWLDVLAGILPLILMAVFLFFIFRQARGAQDIMFSFGRSKARLFAKGKQPTTFADVAGVEEAKKELEEVVDFLKHPLKYRRLGARTPKGVLLVGPSGVGKTLLAKAVAGEAGVPFFSMAGSEFMEMLVGVGASRVRDLFDNAKKSAPSIIFIDEIDAIGRQRGLGFTGGHDEREQTLNQILVEMDGFAPNESVVVLAASVTAETPIMVKQNGEVRLLPIGEFVDQYFPDAHKEGEAISQGVECLGFTRKESTGNLTKGNLYFSHSAFKKVRSVFRHRVKRIFEIEYLGGKFRATGDHSVFVRSSAGLLVKAVSQLKKGDVLIDLPLKVRAHRFDANWSLTLPFFEEEEEEWQRGASFPRPISKNYFKHCFPKNIRVTPSLCRLLGYYTAEGYARKEVDFCFSSKETEEMSDLVGLVERCFGIRPDRIRETTHNAINIIYSATPLARFLIRWCGKGAANKHLPSFLFEAPYPYFREFLKGLWYGDGYTDRAGRGEITSVSRRLIRELNWLSRMHGIKTYIHEFTAREGRRVAGGKPLKATRAYRLGWGKTNHPFAYFSRERTYPLKRAIVQKVKPISFNGFVYDLCGVDNEAFFGGESPILLHNTNRPDMLDAALIRPGRFDRRVILEMPDVDDRKEILAIHARGKPFSKDVNWDKVARVTVGFSGADLENMLNEAAIFAARQNKREINMADINEASLKVKLGPEKKIMQSDEDRKMTAYHEAGHAVVSYHQPRMDPVNRISIVSRGMAMGFTFIPPKKDRYNETRSHLLETITTLLGGRAAEELVFNEFTAGAASDIDKATSIIRKMVVDFGMSRLGPVYLGPQIEETDYGKTWWQPSEISPKMASKVDEEIKRITDECYLKAKEILKKQKTKLDLLAKKLLEKETIDGEEFKKLMKT